MNNRSNKGRGSLMGKLCTYVRSQQRAGGKLSTASIIIVTLFGCTSNINHFNNQFKFNTEQLGVLKNQLDNWRLQGKISWHQKQPNQSVICYVDWQKNNKKSRIDFRSIMNIKSVSIESENNKIKVISSSDNISEVQKDVDAMSKAISLNLNNLNYWLLGVPNPKHEYFLLKDGFKQQNWHIIYLKYKTQGGVILPDKILMRNINSQTVIKIAISSFFAVNKRESPSK